MIWIENNTDLFLLDPRTGSLFLAVQGGRVLPVWQKTVDSTAPIPSWVVNEVDSFVVFPCSSGVFLVSFEKNYREKSSFLVVRELFGDFGITRTSVSFDFKFHVFLDVESSDKVQLVDYEKNQTWGFSPVSFKLEKLFDNALVRLKQLQIIWNYEPENYLGIHFGDLVYRIGGYDKYFLISTGQSFAIFHVLKKDSSISNSYQEELLVIDFKSLKISFVTSDLGFSIIHDASHVWVDERYFLMFLAGCEESSPSLLLVVDIYRNIFLIIRVEDSSFFNFESFASFASFVCDKGHLFLISSNGGTMKIFDEKSVLVPELEKRVVRFDFKPLSLEKN